ncbi:hypothetical protein ACJJTC_001811 [Scirpophaga incertulas]
MGRCVSVGCEEMGTHKFPSNPNLRRKWDRALKRMNFKATDYSRLCSNHFKDTDFETISKETGFPLQRKVLKKSAVPTVFYWNSTSSPNTSSRAERYERRNTKRCLIPNTMTSREIDESLHSNITILSTDQAYAHEVEISNINVESTDIVHSPGPSKNDHKSTQTSTFCRIFVLDDLLIDNTAIHFYTGLENNDKFKLVLSTLCPMAYNLKYKGSQVINISIEDQFLLMLIKLRRNKCDYELSKFFGISKTLVSNIFITWLNFTYDMWSLIDIWPERQIVDYYMPAQFKKSYANTRIIIDGTEIPITKPKHPISQQATFSSYKNKNTMKFLVGATPGGLFSYCSEGYGGSTSDRQMIERSNLLEKCEPADSIMADRGFNVQDIFAAKGIGINIPTFLKGKSQLSGITVKRDRLLASQRVHIERLIGLSKTFRILKSDLNPYYVPLASRIFFVCIMLCNFREGIVNKLRI